MSATATCPSCDLPTAACCCHTIPSAHQRKVYHYNFETQILTVIHGTRRMTADFPIPERVLAHLILTDALDGNEIAALRWIRPFMGDVMDEWRGRGRVRIDLEEVRVWLAYHRQSLAQKQTA